MCYYRLGWNIIDSLVEIHKLNSGKLSKTPNSIFTPP